MNEIVVEPSGIFYRCVRCHSNLEEREDVCLTCERCGATYPSIDGVKVLTLRPDHFLRSQVNRLSARRKEVQQGRDSLAAAGAHSQNAIAIANMGYEGQLKNLELVDRVMEPAREYLASRPESRGLFDSFYISDNGWPIFSMLSHFYKDWGDTEAARLVADLCAGATDRYCGSGRDSVVVLGCGAGRLLYDISGLFGTVLGVDLAIDCMLLSKVLLDGGDLELSFSFPNPRVPVAQKTVGLQGAKERRDNIKLVAADVSRLPFASSSVSCVITPYLLDIVPDPDAVLSEIRRVLAPKGLWFNFSNLFGISRSEGTMINLDDLDISSYFSRSGFQLLHESMHRYTSSMYSVSEWATSVTESPLLVVAERASSEDEERTDPLAGYFAGDKASIWAMVPIISTHIGLIHERIFSCHGLEERNRIVNFSKNNTGSATAANSRNLTDPNRAMAEGLLRAMDGTRTMGEVLSLLAGQYGDIIKADELVDLFLGLRDVGFVELKDR